MFDSLPIYSKDDVNQPFFMCQRFLLIGCTLIAVSIAIVLFGILAFGNPQRHSIIYIFQWKVYPGKLPKVPQDYSGEWVKWHANGKKASMSNWKDGQLDGLWTAWREDGSLHFSGLMRNWKAVGPWIRYPQIGQAAEITWFVDGKKVDEVEYRDAAAKDPTLPQPSKRD